MKEAETAEIRILAPAKVNLFLEILGKRPDGYHEICTLMQPISLFDTLRIAPAAEGLKIVCPGHPGLERENNLVVRAVRLLERELDRPIPLSVLLNKRIPLGAGLGGGSSDAAAALSAANRLSGEPLSPERLEVLAGEIGSDVPFFLRQQTALAVSRGERLEPWPSFHSFWYVLVYPGFPISTSWAYGQVKLPLTENEKTTNIKRLKEQGEIPGRDLFKNDLEAAVLPFFPVLGKIKTALSGQGCLQALMSGSGSTVFGIWEKKKEAEKACGHLKQEGWGDVFLARGL
jgi:4-diphosphocytidyl-2-C-methyl-D-erythritol kinase